MLQSAVRGAIRSSLVANCGLRQLSTTSSLCERIQNAPRRQDGIDGVQNSQRRRGAMQLNRVELMGGVARDPIKRTTVRGSDFVVLTVITNRSLEKADGSVLEEVEPHSCISFRPGQVDYILNNIQRGSRVLVQGALHYENVRSVRDDMQSPMIKQASIRIENIHLLKRSDIAGGRTGGGGGGGGDRRGGKRDAVEDDEL